MADKKYHTSYDVTVSTTIPDGEIPDACGGQNVWETLTNRGNAFTTCEGESICIPYHATQVATLTKTISQVDKYDAYCWSPSGSSECDSLVDSAIVDCSTAQ